MSTAAAAPELAAAPPPKKGVSKPGKKKVSKALKAGLIMPVGRIRSTIKKGCYHNCKLSNGAPIFLSGALQYLITEVMEMSSLKLMKRHNDSGIRITPRRIMLAIAEDAEFSVLFRNVQIPKAGIAPTLKSKKVSDFKNEHMGIGTKKVNPADLESAEDAEKAAPPKPPKKKSVKAAEKAADKKKAKPPKDADMVDDGKEGEEEEEGEEDEDY